MYPTDTSKSNWLRKIWRERESERGERENEGINFKSSRY